MKIFYDGVIAFLSAVGLSALIWSAAELLLRRTPQLPAGVTLVLPLRGEGVTMEADVAKLEQLCRTLPKSRLILQDCGLSREALALARCLALKKEGVLLLGAQDPLPPP